MQELPRPHIDSFNFVAQRGLRLAVKHLPPLELDAHKGRSRVQISIASAELRPPVGDSQQPLLPSVCRRAGLTYSGPLIGRLRFAVNGQPIDSLETKLGEIPVMVRSRVCHLYQRDAERLTAAREEFNEMGGYFIINGHERIIRMLVMPRRNYPIAVSRPSFTKKGKWFSDKAIIVRCVTPDQTASINILHWRNGADPMLAFTYEKEQFYAPVGLLLRATFDGSLAEIYQAILLCHKEVRDTSLVFTAKQILLYLLTSEKFRTRQSVLEYLGEYFRHKLRVSAAASAAECGRHLLERSVLTHCTEDSDKFHLLCLMVRKLHSVVKGTCCIESNDSLLFQEVMLPGHLYLQVLKDILYRWLLTVRKILEKKLAKTTAGQAPIGSDVIKNAIHLCSRDITAAMENFMATGNLNSQTLLLMQSSGLVIPADNINKLRFAAHFRAIHRGSFFAEMRTSGVRRLLPETWGYICPVHTPDGTPCGLLNHLTADCVVVCMSEQPDSSALIAQLALRGLIPLNESSALNQDLQDCLPVLLDGVLCGMVPQHLARGLSNWLRAEKTSVEDSDLVPRSMEIALVPKVSGSTGPYPGLYLFTDAARMLRPVKNLTGDCVEYVGPYEQCFLGIAIDQKSLQADSTHCELKPNSIFSFVASLTPYPDFNQSPRNIYQCQMGKQSMGHVYYSHKHRADNKLYRLLSPQAPLVKTKAYDEFKMDENALGFNAVVAVVSYTGYDMEDAMIINKASYERGFGDACIYKSQVVDLNKVAGMGRHKSAGVFGSSSSSCPLRFGVGAEPVDGLDQDGFPPIGSRLAPGAPLYSYFNEDSRHCTVVKYKGDPGFLDSVSSGGSAFRATLTIRQMRRPDIGDKFSSRHGQKGVNSMLLPAEDMPFTSDGMVPDIIFNPHGFPSRMTVGMMIEFIAGKAAALSGKTVDASAFQRDGERDTPVFEDCASVLRQQGFNYWGTEPMYCGTTGRQLEAQIFFGVVYYQRLRHMVADKFQVRSLGPIDNTFRQPAKGRKIGGGVRLGEMERDALISHGASYVIQDRLVDCSDGTFVRVCSACGSLLTPLYSPPGNEAGADTWKCAQCEQSSSVVSVRMGHVWRYLCMELAGQGIRVVMDVRPRK